MKKETNEAKRVTGECKLCGNFGELQNSHIIPAFVIRYIRETGLIKGGGLRFSDQPNRVVQDGEKRHWLCKACEEEFSQDEQKFSERIFKPINTGHQPALVYGEELLRFCVSLSWRTLLRYQEIECDETEQRPLSELDEKDQEVIASAETEWRNYLNGEGQSSERFIHHICIVGEIDSSNTDLYVGINKYIRRGIHQDIIRGKTLATIYTKLPGVFVFGILRDEETRAWYKTEVQPSGGTLPWNEAVGLPNEFAPYLDRHAKKYQELPDSLSERQRKRTDQKVDRDVERDPERMRKSSMFRAIEADEKLAQSQGHSTLIKRESKETMETGDKPMPSRIALFEEEVTPEVQSKAAYKLREIGMQAGLKGHIEEEPGFGTYFTTGVTVQGKGQSERIEIRGCPILQNIHGQVLVSFIAKCDYTGYTDKEMQNIKSKLLEGNQTATFARYAKVKDTEKEAIVAVADAVVDTLQPLEMFRLVFHVARLVIERPRLKKS